MGSTGARGHGQALGIVWCGTRTSAFAATAGFFERVLGLPAGAQGAEILLERRTARGGWSHFRAPDGNVYEVRQIP